MVDLGVAALGLKYGAGGMPCPDSPGKFVDLALAFGADGMDLSISEIPVLRQASFICIRYTFHYRERPEKCCEWSGLDNKTSHMK